MSKNSGSKKVTLGDGAYSFSDASTGIFIAKGEVKELTPRQLSTLKIKKALHTGHLQLVTVAADLKEKESENLSKLVSKFEAMVNKGLTSEKISGGFTDAEIDNIANEYGLVRDEGETSITVIDSIINEITSKAESEKKD